MKTQLLLTSLSIVGLSGFGACAQETPAPSNSSNIDKAETVLPILQDCGDLVDFGVNEVVDVRIEGDQLKATAVYGGGCQDHEFSVCWNGSFAESMPVQTGLKLIHHSNTDFCEALVSTDLTIDLSLLKETYQDWYQTDEGEISLGFADTRVLYSFAAEQSLEEQFNQIAADANYMSESDSTPTFLSAQYPGAGAINRSKIRHAFGDTLQIQADQAIELWSAAEAKAFLNDQIEYDEGNAWQLIKTFIYSNLTGVRGAKIGPADENGGLATDQGSYYILILGKSADGQLVGFYVESVET